MVKSSENKNGVMTKSYKPFKNVDTKGFSDIFL